MVCPTSVGRYIACILLCPVSSVIADGPADNIPDRVRPVPPVGIEIQPDDRTDLERGLSVLDQRLRKLNSSREYEVQRLVPDVEIFARAIRHGLAHRELFSERDVKNAKLVLEKGLARADALLGGTAPWTTQKGLVVRGFRSRIDQTVQPYGLVIPDSYNGNGKSKYRLDLWLHGRGERSSESVFIAERMQHVGRFSPADTIVLHPYGRYINAFKLAGEVDVLESLQHVQANYRIDPDRIAVRGFSMGGAGCWQLAVHYPSMFFANSPGAGFSETPEFLKFFQQETLNPTWYERKLWRMYDCPGYAVNLFNLPTVAYSGELDIQKQAADIMESALQDEGMRLTHIIGAQTKHNINDASKKIIEAKLSSLAEQGRDQLPSEVRFATYTLKYHKSHWLTLTGLREHWEPARAVARLDVAHDRITVSTQNITSFRIDIPAGKSPFAVNQAFKVVVARGRDGDRRDPTMEFTNQRPESDRSIQFACRFEGNRWHQIADKVSDNGLRKIHGLQGPIDDAFMDSFIVVRPTGTARNTRIDNWAGNELQHLVREWRRQFRGDAIVKDDAEVTPADVANNNLILFGDQTSNKVIARIAEQLPIQWSQTKVTVGDRTFDASHHALILVYPNPENPTRYVVLNSGFTYREFAYLNNARQVPKLPDWAVVDIRTPADSLWPGKIVAADFFDEQWRLKPSHKP